MVSDIRVTKIHTGAAVIALDYKTATYIRKILQANLKYDFEVRIAAAKLLFSKKSGGVRKL